MDASNQCSFEVEFLVCVKYCHYRRLHAVWWVLKWRIHKKHDFLQAHTEVRSLHSSPLPLQLELFHLAFCHISQTTGCAQIMWQGKKNKLLRDMHVFCGNGITSTGPILGPATIKMVEQGEKCFIPFFLPLWISLLNCNTNINYMTSQSSSL